MLGFSYTGEEFTKGAFALSFFLGAFSLIDIRGWVGLVGG